MVDDVLTLHRIVLTDPTTERDMFSQARLGKLPRERDAETLRRWRGISLFDGAVRAGASDGVFHGMEMLTSPS